MNQKLTKYALLIILGISAAFFVGCFAQDGKDGVAGTSVIDTCTTNCHSSTTTLGLKIKEAQGQWDQSTHARGL